MSKRMIHAPMACTIVDVLVSAGDSVRAGQPLLIVEAMKMEHEIRAEADGTVLQVAAWAGEAVSEGDLLLQLAAEASTPAPIQAPAQAPTPASAQAPVPASVRADLQEVRDRHALTLDAARPEAVAKRHALGLRTARENVGDLCDPGSFIEYGALAFAAQRSRRSLDDLVKNTPADGMVTGIGSITARCSAPTNRAAS